MDDNRSTRDRVRALVKDVLQTAVVIDDDQSEQQPATIAGNIAAPFSEFKQKDFANPNIVPAEFDRDESAKTLLTESDLRGLERGAKLRVAENVRLTPLASDFVREQNIELIAKSSGINQTKVKTVAIGADHGGYELKERLKEFLSNQDLQIRDFGTNSEAAVDYPDFAFAVARAIADKQADVGIMVDGAGIGSAITANKVAGVRAAACYNPSLARNAREHNGANVLTLGSKQNSFTETCEIVTAFLTTDLTEERHRRRVEKIMEIEQQIRK